ncbi:MAG: PleD family two-component system response regulator, partial [Nitrospinales bacterium]
MKNKLLVADDSVTIQKIIAMAFENENTTIESVNDGKSAFKRLSKIKPDIVIANVDLPKIDGFELSQKIKSTRRLKSIPVLLLTSDFEDFDEVKFKESKANDYITKPFKSEDIVASVKNLLKKSASKKQTEIEPEPKQIESVTEPIEDVETVEVTQDEETDTNEIPASVEIAEENESEEVVPIKLSSIDILEDSSAESSELEEVVILEEDPQEDLEEVMVVTEEDLEEVVVTEEIPNPDDIPTVTELKDKELQEDDAKESVEEVFAIDESPAETILEDEASVEEVLPEALEEVAVLSEHSIVESESPQEENETNASSINNLFVDKPMPAETENNEMTVDELLRSAKELLGEEIDEEEPESEDSELSASYEEVPLRVEPLKEWVPPPTETNSIIEEPEENEIASDPALAEQNQEVSAETEPENESPDAIIADTAPLDTESLDELDETFKELHHLTGVEESGKTDQADIEEAEESSKDEEPNLSETPEVVSVNGSLEQGPLGKP